MNTYHQICKIRCYINYSFNNKDEGLNYINVSNIYILRLKFLTKKHRDYVKKTIFYYIFYIKKIVVLQNNKFLQNNETVFYNDKTIIEFFHNLILDNKKRMRLV